jgi:hypothetical protein
MLSDALKCEASGLPCAKPAPQHATLEARRSQRQAALTTADLATRNKIRPLLAPRFGLPPLEPRRRTQASAASPSRKPYVGGFRSGFQWLDRCASKPISESSIASDARYYLHRYPESSRTEAPKDAAQGHNHRARLRHGISRIACCQTHLPLPGQEVSAIRYSIAGCVPLNLEPTHAVSLFPLREISAVDSAPSRLKSAPTSKLTIAR